MRSEPRLEPVTRAEGYSVDAYCKHCDAEAVGFGMTKGQAYADLRGQGWILHRDDLCTCPRCKADKSAWQF